MNMQSHQLSRYTSSYDKLPQITATILRNNESNPYRNRWNSGRGNKILLDEDLQPFPAPRNVQPR